MISKEVAKAAVEVLREYCKQFNFCEGCEIQHDMKHCDLAPMLLNLEWKDEQ